MIVLVLILILLVESVRPICVVLYSTVLASFHGQHCQGIVSMLLSILYKGDFEYIVCCTVLYGTFCVYVQEKQ